MSEKKVVTEKEVAEEVFVAEEVEAAPVKVVEEKKVSLFGKAVAGTKKHGKKVLIGLGLGLAAGIGYAIGANSNKKSDTPDNRDDYYGNDDYDDTSENTDSSITNF